MSVASDQLGQLREAATDVAVMAWRDAATVVAVCESGTRDQVRALRGQPRLWRCACRLWGIMCGYVPLETSYL